MSSGVRLRPSYSLPGCFAPCGDRDGDGDAYIARPVAEDAARERVVEAAIRFALEDRRKPRRGDEAADALGQLFLAVEALKAPAQGGEG